MTRRLAFRVIEGGRPDAHPPLPAFVLDRAPLSRMPVAPAALVITGAVGAAVVRPGRARVVGVDRDGVQVVSARQRSVWCCGCLADVQARLTDGAEIYPHRADLADLPFWRCDACGNHVGCHWKTKDRTRPLGVIPTREIKDARQHLHRVIDPIWQSGRMKRAVLYQRISAEIGRQYHTAEIRSVEEARDVWRAVQKITASPLSDAP